MEQKTVASLMQATTLMNGIVLSCVDRKRFPFTKTQLSIFTVLDLEGELTMKQIARYLSTSQEQATRAVAPLADAGYVERHTDPANRTHVKINLTETGRKLFEDNRISLRENLSAKLDNSLSGEEKDCLYRAVSDVVQLLEKIK